MTQPRVRLGGDAITGAREEQQDAFAAGLAVLANGRSAKLAVVVDGMGGHVGGALAASLALAAFLRAAESGRWSRYDETLRAALDIANDAIAARVEQEPCYRGMGCTLVAVIFDDDSLWMISVGDSLLLRVGASALERLNADHSMAPLVEGSAAMDGANPQRHLLRSALTGGPIALIDARRFAQAGDMRIVLASDGLLTLAPATILEILLGTAGREPEQQAKALLRAVEAEALPDQDNCTVIVVDCGTVAVRTRRVRPVIGGLLLAAGAGALGYAWWGAGNQRSPVAIPRQTAVRSPGGTPSGVTTVRRDGYPRARDAVPSEPAPAPTRLASGMLVPVAKATPVPLHGKLELDLPALLADDTVTAPARSVGPNAPSNVLPQPSPQPSPTARAPSTWHPRDWSDYDR